MTAIFNLSNLENIDSNKFTEIFTQILEQKFSDDKIIEILLKINQLQYPVEAMIGAFNALKSKMLKINVSNNLLAQTIDLCGTGGDCLNSFNISTATSFVVASCGVKVAKNGNRASSSKSGSADIFEILNIEFSKDEESIISSLENNNLVFLFAPYFHQSLKNIAPIRKLIKQPTIFNYLGPLLNPLQVDKQIIGVANASMIEKMSQVIISQKISQKEVYFVNGDDGMDELTLTANSQIIKLINGNIKKEVFNPTDFGFEKVDMFDLTGGSPEYNAKALIDLLDGKKSPYRNIVVINSALALILAKKANNFQDAVKLVESRIDDGDAKNILTKMQKKI